jgi:NAD(P)-dependent dehydrogenase (short-subunit alcohol dehydrogenase family)
MVNIMKTVVITGSTMGIGFGLAEAFLQRDCQVVVSGRTQEKVDHAVNILSEKYDPSKIFRQPCDVSDFQQVQALWDRSIERFNRIDIWINNAGQGQAIVDFWTLDSALIKSVVEANLLGQMYGAKVALSGMLKQGHGSFYLMEGKGSKGDVQNGFTLYGTTKRGVNFLFHSLVKEVKHPEVIVGSLSPGMVVTGLLTRQKEADPEGWERTKKIFNILADSVENVSPWLVEKILANTKHGSEIKYMSTAKVMLRFLTAPFSKRDLFAEE